MNKLENINVPCRECGQTGLGVHRLHGEFRIDPHWPPVTSENACSNRYALFADVRDAALEAAGRLAVTDDVVRYAYEAARKRVEAELNERRATVKALMELAGDTC